MQKNKLLRILLPVAGGLICGICIAAVFFVSGHMKNDKHYELVRSARQYLMDGDYENVIASYKAAIDLKPENPESYVELISLFMEDGQYVEAADYARLGFTATRDRRFESLLEEINTVRYTRGSNPANADKNDENDPEDTGAIKAFVAKARDDSKVTLRSLEMEALAGYCYQEYVDEFGSATAVFVSDDEGYRVRFAGLGAETYFKNTQEYPHLIDNATRIPEKNACPYKVLLTSPSFLFVNYGGYISYERLCQLFKTDVDVKYDEVLAMYCLEFQLAGCHVVIETDSAGNVYKSKPFISFSPHNLIKEDWEEPETQSEETEEETFVLGGQTYTYDVTEIEIYSQSIDDLSPLSRCSQLEALILEDCTIGSLEPLAGCTSLVYVDLRGSVGFSDIRPLSGLSNLAYLDLHSCSGVSDISPIMDMSLTVLHTCETGVSYEQTLEYKQRHPDCDNHVI